GLPRRGRAAPRPHRRRVRPSGRDRLSGPDEQEHKRVAATVIGRGITIEGEVTSDDEVVVAGVLRGKLDVEGAVTIEADGVVEADIGAASVAIGGNVTGNVTAS